MGPQRAEGHSRGAMVGAPRLADAGHGGAGTAVRLSAALLRAKFTAASASLVTVAVVAMSALALAILTAIVPGWRAAQISIAAVLRPE